VRRVPFALVALAVIAVLLLTAALGCSKPTGVDAPADQKRSVSPAPAAEATTKPEAWTLDVSSFVPAKATWRKIVTSVTVRGDWLDIAVTRAVTKAEVDEIRRAAEAARSKNGLSVEHFMISYAKNNYLLSYGPLG
jgi:hypothetical protein